MAPTQHQIIQRRRGLALAAIALVAVLIFWGFQSMAGGTNQAGVVSETTTESETIATPAEITECGAGLVKLEAFIGLGGETRNTFKSDENPEIWYQITNTGLQDCLFNIGARATFFTITSGDQTYWSSKDCDRTGLTDTMLTLSSNKSVPAQSSTWLKVRSSSTGCGEGQDSVPGGGASYHLKVEVNGVISENTQQFILN